MIYPLIFIVLCIIGYQVSERYPYWAWKRRVRKVAPELCSICCVCNDPIYPKEFVGQTSDGRLVHAGFHFSLTKGECAFCETGSIGIGFWDGEKVAGKINSAAEIACNIGKSVIRDIDPDGKVQTRTF